MPMYEFACPDGHEMVRLVPMSERNAPRKCYCGKPTQLVIAAPSLKADGAYSFNDGKGEK